jgi:hypothetical protein
MKYIACFFLVLSLSNIVLADESIFLRCDVRGSSITPAGTVNHPPENVSVEVTKIDKHLFIQIKSS